MPVVDTSALVALLDPAHPHHVAARRELATGPIFASWGALQEVTVVMRRRAKAAGQDGNRAGRAALRAVTGLAGFREAPPLGLASVVSLFEGLGPLGFADAWALAVALHLREPLVTFDKALRAAHTRRT